MADTNNARQSELDERSLDEFFDVESDRPWSREHTRSLGFLLGGFAIIVAVFTLGCLLG